MKIQKAIKICGENPDQKELMYASRLIKSRLNSFIWCSSHENSPTIKYLNATTIGTNIIFEILIENRDYLIREAQKVSTLTGNELVEIMDTDFILFHIQQSLAMRKLPKLLESQAEKQQEFIYLFKTNFTN